MDFLEKMYGLSRRRAGELIIPEGERQPVRSFRAALESPGMALIAEVKYATPADGMLGVGDAPDVIAREYERLGAAAVSCLTEPDHFAGRLEYLAVVRSGCSLPVMMKDFIVDERQIVAGRAFGADAVLLITELLSLDELRVLHARAQGLGMDCLVEVHGPAGLDKALELGAEIVGVNCRDLRTLEVHGRRHEELVTGIPAGVIKVAESGVTSGERLRELWDAGYDAALVGRAFACKALREEIFHVGQDLRHHQA